VDFYSYRCPDAGMKKTVIRTGVYDRFKSFAGRVIVNELNGKYRAPDSSLFGNASIA